MPTTSHRYDRPQEWIRGPLYFWVHDDGKVTCGDRGVVIVGDPTFDNLEIALEHYGITLREFQSDWAQEMSYSRLATWLRCRHAYVLIYDLGLEPRFDKPKIDLGIAVHAGLAAALLQQSVEQAIEGWYAKITKGFEHLFSEDEHEILSDIREKSYGITSRTMKQLDIGHRFETIVHGGKPMVEFQFTVPVPDWNAFNGRVDWIAREIENGNVWLIDHKVREAMTPESHEEFNLQMAIYQHLISQMMPDLASNIGGSAQHQIRAALPKQPKRNKDGSMSRAACATDWETYEAALLAVGLNPLEYQDMKDKLSEVEFWRWSKSYRSATEVQNIWRDAEQATINLARSPATYRSLNPMTCGMCRVREFCMTELRAGDTEFLLATQYRLRGHDRLPVLLSAEFEE